SESETIESFRRGSRIREVELPRLDWGFELWSEIPHPGRTYKFPQKIAPYTRNKRVFPGLATDVFLASVGSAVYFAGYKPGTTPNTTDIFVRAYDIATGHVLWDNLFDKGRDDLPQALDANVNAVVVAGYGGNTGGSFLDFIVRAYDPVTGAILWDEQLDK